MWSKYPDNEPLTPGYYYTYYYYTEKDRHFYKAHYWNGGEWIWNRGRVPVVKGFIEESYNPYYVPCTLWGYEEERTDRIGIFPEDVDVKCD